MYTQIFIGEVVSHTVVIAVFGLALIEYIRGRIFGMRKLLTCKISLLAILSSLMFLIFFILEFVELFLDFNTYLVEYTLLFSAILPIVVAYKIMHLSVGRKDHILFFIFIISILMLTIISPLYYIELFKNNTLALVVASLHIVSFTTYILFVMSVFHRARKLRKPQITKSALTQKAHYFIYASLFFILVFGAAYASEQVRIAAIHPEKFEALTIMYPIYADYEILLAGSLIAESKGYFAERNVRVYESIVSEYLSVSEKISVDQTILGLMSENEAVASFSEGLPITIVAYLYQRDTTNDANVIFEAIHKRISGHIGHNDLYSGRFVLVTHKDIADFAPNVLYDYIDAFFDGWKYINNNQVEITGFLLNTLFPYGYTYDSDDSIRKVLYELSRVITPDNGYTYGHIDTDRLAKKYAEYLTKHPELELRDTRTLSTSRFLKQ